jgi:hypothetical protein
MAAGHGGPVGRKHESTTMAFRNTFVADEIGHAIVVPAR